MSFNFDTCWGKNYLIVYTLSKPSNVILVFGIKDYSCHKLCLYVYLCTLRKAFEMNEVFCVIKHKNHTNSRKITYFQVIGDAGVTLIDLTHAQVHPSKHFNISGVYVTYLTKGDVIGLADQAVTFASTKTPMRGHEQRDNVLTSTNVFAREDIPLKPEFVKIATSVFDARRGRTTHGFSKETGPRFRVDMSASENDAVGYVERHTSAVTDATSYKNLRVSIYEG